MNRETNNAWATIIGIGEDGCLPPPAKAAVAAAELVVGGRRHLALVDGLGHGDRLAWPQPIEAGYNAILARKGQRVVILASGDPFFFGVGSALAERLAPGDWRALPALSSLSLAASRLGWALDRVGLVSLCGRPLSTLRPQLQPGARLFVLSADETTPGQVASVLDMLGFGPSKLHLLEALGGSGERQRTSPATGFALTDIQPLNLLAIEVEATSVARPIPLCGGLDDDFFAHDGQITKREIRTVTLSSLAPKAGERLWDIGAGSGSIAIEWLLRHPANRATAVESDGERAARIGRNAEALGVPHLELVHGRAPEALADLPPPQAVFIGGGVHLPGIIDRAWAALPTGGRLVANGVTLETERTLIDARERLGGTLLRLGVERLEAIGRFSSLRPALTVTQWLAVKS